MSQDSPTAAHAPEPAPTTPHGPRSRFHLALRWLSLLLLFGFVAFMVSAMSRYPGGTWQQPEAVGHDFWRNFWCDLLRETTYGGAPNPGVTHARNGVVAFALALWPFWYFSTLSWPRRPLAWAVNGLGGVSSLGLLYLALRPSDLYPELHAPAVVGFGFVGLTCATLVLADCLRRRPLRRTSAVAGLAALFFAVLNLGLYIQLAAFDGSDDFHLVPIAQKLATTALLVWMAATVAPARSR